MPAVHIKRLQKIQNEAARLVTLTPRREHITPILQSLHWLPVQQRIEYKVLMIVFKTLHNAGPEYLRELLVSYDPGRCLRSRDRHLLFEPRYRLASAGLRSFGSSGPKALELVAEEYAFYNLSWSFQKNLEDTSI